MDTDDTLGIATPYRPRFALRVNTGESDDDSTTALATPMTGTNQQLVSPVQPSGSMGAPIGRAEMQTNLHSGSSASGRANNLTINVDDEPRGDAQFTQSGAFQYANFFRADTTGVIFRRDDRNNTSRSSGMSAVSYSRGHRSETSNGIISMQPPSAPSPSVSDISMGGVTPTAASMEDMVLAGTPAAASGSVGSSLGNQSVSSSTVEAMAIVQPSPTASGSATNAQSDAIPTAASSSDDKDSTSAGATAHRLRREVRLVKSLDDLAAVETLGQGASGVVQRVVHKPDNRIFALKTINLDMNETKSKQVVTEVDILHEASSPYIVSYYGAFFKDRAMSVVLEYMDSGSLLDALKVVRRISEPILSSIARSVLRGLLYLHKTRRIIHRDIKPCNILLNRKGEVKLADFGVSGQLQDAEHKHSFVGTLTYMSPQRIQAEVYSFDSDIWSLGLALMECATGEFPYQFQQPKPNDGADGAKAKNKRGSLTFFDVFFAVVQTPPPQLPEAEYSAEFRDFLSHCLQKDSSLRAPADKLLEHPWITKCRVTQEEMAQWVQSVTDARALAKQSFAVLDTGLTLPPLDERDEPDSGRVQRARVASPPLTGVAANIGVSSPTILPTFSTAPMSVSNSAQSQSQADVTIAPGFLALGAHPSFAASFAAYANGTGAVDPNGGMNAMLANPFGTMVLNGTMLHNPFLAAAAAAAGSSSAAAATSSKTGLASYPQSSYQPSYPIGANGALHLTESRDPFSATGTFQSQQLGASLAVPGKPGSGRLSDSGSETSGSGDPSAETERPRSRKRSYE